MSGVVVRRCGFDRRPAPFSGQLSPWPAFGTPGGAWSRSGTGSRPGWGGPAFHTDAPELGLVPSFLGAAPHQFLALWSLGPLAFVLAAFLLPGFQLCWCRLYPWLRRPGLGRGLLPVGRLLFGLGVSGGCPAGGGRFLGPYPAVGLLEWEDVDKYMSFRRVHPRVGGATAKVRGGKKLKKGLSPRGRGNRDGGGAGVQGGGSIPAWAGEPGKMNSSLQFWKVYPRVGGGTQSLLLSSPRVRGLSRCVFLKDRNCRLGRHPGHLPG